MIKLISTKYMDFKSPPKNRHGVIKDEGGNPVCDRKGCRTPVIDKGGCSPHR
jgi:hypothetical protein